MKNWEDFLYFTKLQLETGDYDTHIPFLVEASKGWAEEERVEIGFLYMAYYNEAAAWFASQSTHLDWNPRLPVEKQRRNLYGGRIADHLASLRTYLPWVPKLRACQSWSDLLILIESVYGNGRWATYTTAELMTRLIDLPFEPDSFEVMNSSGPRKGLIDLGLEPNEKSGAMVHDRLACCGVTLSYSQLESILCDWHGMCRGSFYAGRNIDRQEERIFRVERILNIPLQRPWEIRHTVFPFKALGEHHWWFEMDEQRMLVYRETGRVLAPWEERLDKEIG